MLVVISVVVIASILFVVCGGHGMSSIFLLTFESAFIPVRIPHHHPKLLFFDNRRHFASFTIDIGQILNVCSRQWRPIGAPCSCHFIHHLIYLFSITSPFWFVRMIIFIPNINNSNCFHSLHYLFQPGNYNLKITHHIQRVHNQQEQWLKFVERLY